MDIRKELWIVPAVGCVNSQARLIAVEFLKKRSELEGVDGVFAHTPPTAVRR